MAAVPDAIPDPAHEPWAARRADALVAICEHALARDGGRLLVDPAALPMLVQVDIGRRRRILPCRLRRALQGRGRTCHFPGCAVPSQRTHAHHVEHWADGGPTDLGNLVNRSYDPQAGR